MFHSLPLSSSTHSSVRRRSFRAPVSRGSASGSNRFRKRARVGYNVQRQRFPRTLTYRRHYYCTRHTRPRTMTDNIIVSLAIIIIRIIGTRLFSKGFDVWDRSGPRAVFVASSRRDDTVKSTGFSSIRRLPTKSTILLVYRLLGIRRENRFYFYFFFLILLEKRENIFARTLGSLRFASPRRWPSANANLNGYRFTCKLHFGICAAIMLFTKRYNLV